MSGIALKTNSGEEKIWGKKRVQIEMLSHGHNSYRNSYKTFKPWIGPTNGSRKLALGNPKSPKNLNLKKTPPHGNLNSKKGDIRLSEMNSNGLKEMGKVKGSRRNEPPSHLFPYCKAAKYFPTVTQYKTSVQSIWLYIKEDVGASFFWGFFLFVLYVFILHMSKRIL